MDVLVNNAGINTITSLEEAKDEGIREMMVTDLIGPMHLIKGSIRRLRRSNFGRIVNIGSIWATVSKEGRSLYSATKNGLHGMTNALALELAYDGILVNTVCPGYTKIELTVQNNTPEEIYEIEKKIPLKRMADPYEIARVVYFLGNEENTYITGQKIMVDGGYCVQ